MHIILPGCSDNLYKNSCIFYYEDGAYDCRSLLTPIVQNKVGMIAYCEHTSHNRAKKVGTTASSSILT